FPLCEYLLNNPTARVVCLKEPSTPRIFSCILRSGESMEMFTPRKPASTNRLALTLSINVPLVVIVTRMPSPVACSTRSGSCGLSMGSPPEKWIFLQPSSPNSVITALNRSIEMGGSRVSRQYLHISHLRLHP